MEGIVSHHDIEKAILGKDIICRFTSCYHDRFKKCKSYNTSNEKKANKGAVLNPIPFYR